MSCILILYYVRLQIDLEMYCLALIVSSAGEQLYQTSITMESPGIFYVVIFVLHPFISNDVWGCWLRGTGGGGGGGREGLICPKSYKDENRRTSVLPVYGRADPPPLLFPESYVQACSPWHAPQQSELSVQNRYFNHLLHVREKRAELS